MSRLPKLLVLGWYGKGNLGDELMAQSLVSIFEGRAELTFVDSVLVEDMLRHDGLLVGGGSILDSEPNIDDGSLMNLSDGRVPVFFVGVGAETGVHPSFVHLVKLAKIFAHRGTGSVDLKKLHHDPVCVPDLVYAFASSPTDAVIDHGRSSNRVKIIPNYEVAPKWDSPHWKHAAWATFKSEFAQFLDSPALSNKRVSFSCMCVNESRSDLASAHELADASNNFAGVSVAHMTRHSSILGMQRVIITQRFHGAVLAEICGVPYVMIGHHDKMKTLPFKNGVHVPYYGITKGALHAAFERALQMKHEPSELRDSARAAYDRVADSIVNSLQ